jgi:hypothetical protein
MDKGKFYEHEDFEEIRSWYKKRSVEFFDRTVLPNIGFVVPGIGAGFIYMTDSSIAFIEGFITNPEADSKDRNDALDRISENLILYARVMGVKFIKCETKFREIELRAERLGFKSLGQTTSMVKEI